MSFGFTEILVVVALIIIFFGSGRLRNLGSDIGGFIKGLRSSLREVEELPESKPKQTDTTAEGGRVIDAESTAENKDRSS